MVSANLNPSNVGVVVSNTNVSKLPPKVVPWNAVFPGTANFTYFVDLTQIINQAVLDIVQSVFVDNSLNGSALTIQCLVTNQILSVPANSQATLPLFAAPNGPQFNIISSGSGAVHVFFCNFALPGTVWGATSASGAPFAFNSNGYLQTSDVALDNIIINGGLVLNNNYTETDISFTTTGASQQIVARNAARRYFYVQCPASLTSGLWINKAGGTAGVGLSGCLFIAPGLTYETNFLAPSNAINVFGGAGFLCASGVG